MSDYFHKPVLLKEAIKALDIKKGATYIDAALGGGGHTLAILKAGGRVLGIDRDPEAIEFANKHLATACPPGVCQWQTMTGNFANLKEIAKSFNLSKVDGILFDLGVSSHQLDVPERGFSFKSKTLDMRMDPTLTVTAADLINALTEGELYELFTKLGQEKLARPIARDIVHARSLGQINSAKNLAKIIEGVYQKFYRSRSKIQPATKIFLALRTAVNDELGNLKSALPQAVDLLSTGGRLVVISFHSLEDGIVKNFFKESAGKKDISILTKKPILPSESEIKENIRSRSAKLRVAQKL